MGRPSVQPDKMSELLPLKPRQPPKMMPRDQRNDSPWKMPIIPRAPPPEQLLRDSLSDDIFFKAYYDPSLQQILSDWKEELSVSFQTSSTLSAQATANSTTFGTRDGKTPETCFDILVMGRPNVGKTSFIARALGIDMADVHPPESRPVQFNGQTYYFRIRERSLSDIDSKKPESLSQARAKWEKNPERIDGALALYDVYNKDTLDPIPMAMRAIHNTGKTCILTASAQANRADCSAVPQIDTEAVEKKVKLVIGKTKAVKSYDTPDGPYKCLKSLFVELARAYGLPMPPTPKPSIPQSLSANGANHRQAIPELSLASGRGQRSTASSSSFDRAHSPLPHYIGAAVDAGSQNGVSGKRDSHASEPFSPRTFHADAASLGDSDQGSSGTSDELNPDTMKALPSHILELSTFEELVARVCFRDDPRKDTEFDFHFLVFYRFFASALRLLNALISVYDTASSPDDDAITTAVLPDRVLQFLSQWITTHPGDFADHPTYTRLDEFLATFGQTSPFFPVAEQIRMASGKVDEDDDNAWSLPDAVSASACCPAVRTSSHTSASGTCTSPSDLDAKLIFEAHSTLTVEAMGPSHAHTNSVDQSTIPYNITNVAQRQSALLDPSSRLPFTKVQWRQLIALPDSLIAREMTRIDWIMFSAIQPRDMVRHITVSPGQRSRFRELSNVTRMVEHFNHIAYWTTNIILFRDKPKHRALALEKLILVARKLREMNNYNSLGAIVAGIHGTAVHRLAATRELVSPDVQKNFMKLELLMSTQKGHSAYRLAWENSKGPRIPFLPLHRRDLVVAEQGNKTWVTVEEKDGVSDMRINWNKFNILGSMLRDLHEAQSTPYRGFVSSEGIKRLILDVGIVKDDDKLYDRSQMVEPSVGITSSASSARRRLQPWLAKYGLSELR